MEIYEDLLKRSLNIILLKLVDYRINFAGLWVFRSPTSLRSRGSIIVQEFPLGLCQVKQLANYTS